jgi:opacity protein-like surface antigen
MTNKRILLAAMLILLTMSALAAKDAPRAGKALKLFNGKNLDGFYTWIENQGKNQDPDRVFTVQGGMIHVSGTAMGYFATEAEYENYRLTAEFKWGEKTHAPREGKARDSGILHHFVGADKIWPKSIEFQIIEGGTGDIILVDGGAITAGGAAHTEGRIDRKGKGEWKDEVGYRDPAGEVEKPHGQWNKLELIADGDTVKYFVNGKLVNEGSGASPRRGKILFQSEGAEVFYRHIKLTPRK